MFRDTIFFLGLPRVHGIIISSRLIELCSLPQGLVIGIRLQGALVGALWIHTLVPSTCGVIVVVCWGLGVGVCGLCLSHILALRYPVDLSIHPTSMLFCSIAPLSSLGLPHILLAVLR